MADNDGIKEIKNFYIDKPVQDETFYVKGASNCDWGMKNRLSKIFKESSKNTVMLAFDHGYILGPTAGIERMDIVIPELMPYVDVLMATRGALRTSISPNNKNAICLRVNYDSSVIKDDMSNGGGIACDIKNAIKMNADCMAVQTFIGTDGEKNSFEILSRTVDAGFDYGIPTLGVVAVGKQMQRDERFFLLATRMLAENGVQIVKSYYCDGFEKVVSACPVPIVVAGGKKLPENEALTMAYRAISEGARGVDMGRNIFQADSPIAMCRAISAVVHEGLNDKHAFELYQDLRK